MSRSLVWLDKGLRKCYIQYVLGWVNQQEEVGSQRGASRKRKDWGRTDTDAGEVTRGYYFFGFFLGISLSSKAIKGKLRYSS